MPGIFLYRFGQVVARAVEKTKRVCTRVVHSSGYCCFLKRPCEVVLGISAAPQEDIFVVVQRALSFMGVVFVPEDFFFFLWERNGVSIAKAVWTLKEEKNKPSTAEQQNALTFC